jgi:hypothetical protein
MSWYPFTKQFYNISEQMLNTINNIKISNNFVVVFDIDGTLIDTNNNPINPVIDLFNTSVNLGFIPVIITARAGTPENIKHTCKQLENHGIVNYQTIYFRPIHNENQAEFKFIARKNIHELGYIVVASIGDMPWDIGEYGGYGFKLPSLV